MANSRQERMQERMRGAHNHQVEDISFRFDIPLLEPEPPQPQPETEPESQLLPQPQPQPLPQNLIPSAANASVKRSNPNTSAKRKRLDDKGVGEVARSAQSRPPPPPSPPAPAPAAPLTALPPVPAQEQSSLLPHVPPPSASRQDAFDLTHTNDEKTRSDKQRSTLLRRTRTSAPAAADAEDGGPPQSATSAPRPSPRITSSTQRRSTRRRTPPSAASASLVEEVTESPAHAPGSGRRRVMPVSESGSRASLQGSPELGEERSSPLVRKVRRSAASASASAAVAGSGVRRSPRLSAESAEADEPSRDKSVLPGLEEPSPLNGVKAVEAERRGEIELDDAQDAPPTEAEEPEEAEAVADQEAARRLGRKRPRASLRVESPELGVGAPPTEVAKAEPSAKRRRRRAPADSPAAQRQPKAKNSKPRASAKRKSNAEAEENGQVIAVTVQRFKRTRPSDARPEGEDAPNLRIPFATRAGVNAIDVLSTVCEELIEAYLAKLEDRLGEVDAATRREYKAKQRALEAFRENLQTRLLEHTIALDTLYALRKRVRATQTEKLGLRDEILRIRAERDQVALRMDAVRSKHETDSRDALRRISLSSTMHDIDMVIEKGQEAPALSAEEQKMADLANLELLVSRITEQACTNGGGGGGGGALKQIKDFNAFLERAAVVLEGG